MSLITRCPACATTFKVVPDQLRISDGWVRCGQCTEVFDATANLVQEGGSPAGAAAVGQGGIPIPKSPRTEPPAFLRPPAPPPPKPTSIPAATSAPMTPSPLAAGPAQVPVSSPPSQRSAPPPPPRPSREPVMPELVMPDLVLPPPPPPQRAPVPDSPAPVAEPAVVRTADELLAEQLASLDLDLDLGLGDGRRPVEPTLDDDGLGLDLGALLASHPEADEPPPVSVAFEPVVTGPAEPRVRPQGDRFPVLSVPELDLPGTPKPARAGPTGVTLAPLQFPDDPPPSDEAKAKPLAASDLEGAAAARKTDPVSRESVQGDEVSPSLLSESAAVDAPGDLSTQWAAEPGAQAMAAAPTRRAEDEVDAFGPDVLKGLQFLRRARREAFWRRPLVRAGLALAVLLLSGGLVLQWAVHERARLVATEPALRPALQTLCDALGCELTPLRRIESFVIESSAFNKTHGEGFQLALAIRNTGSLPLGMPAAELSLTDSQDQPVLRRVFLPAELGAPATLGPGAEWSATVPVRVASAASLRIAGYRVLVFYP